MKPIPFLLFPLGNGLSNSLFEVLDLVSTSFLMSEYNNFCFYVEYNTVCINVT